MNKYVVIRLLFFALQGVNIFIFHGNKESHPQPVLDVLFAPHKPGYIYNIHDYRLMTYSYSAYRSLLKQLRADFDHNVCMFHLTEKQFQ